MRARGARERFITMSDSGPFVMSRSCQAFDLRLDERGVSKNFRLYGGVCRQLRAPFLFISISAPFGSYCLVLAASQSPAGARTGWPSA